MVRYYNVWKGFSLICPDLEKFRKDNPDKDDFNFSLVGDSSEMVSSKFSFNIDKCDEYGKKDKDGKDDPVRTHCKSDAEIDAKVNQIQLDTW